MRYLSKIFLINSAQIRYAELYLDGNVHFIGTQGVGKSTLLRAILFFYNADSLKLGISKEKKHFSDYYFPYSNSYLVYEVARDEGAYCVLAYRSRNRVCFRFLDGEFNRNHFIDSKNKARESWSEIAKQLDVNGVFYTKRVIDSYQDYRDILYGNNSGKAKELRRYSILESKDYQNIPRTIQNVFLNSELKAEFIKKTIIMSLENDIQIDLGNYDHHLENFETQLNEIKSFRDAKTTSQANSISKLHVAIKYLKAERQQLAEKLVFAVERNGEQEIELAKKLKSEEEKEEGLKRKLDKASELFSSKAKKITGEISVCENKLKTARDKTKKYEEINIEAISLRVSKKPNIEKEQAALTDERLLLTTQFSEISHKFHALFKELENQLKEYENFRAEEKLNVQQDFQDFKSKISETYENRFSKLRADHASDIASVREEYDSKKQKVHALQIEREKIKQKRFFEKEITEQSEEVKKIKDREQKAALNIEHFQGQIGTLQQQWEVANRELKSRLERDLEKSEAQIKVKHDLIAEIDGYIEGSKNSLYGWLSENHPNWEMTIGKVIDEKNVLFNSRLSPRLSDKKDTSFFGIELNLDEIDKTVKTVSDHQKEKEQLLAEIEILRKELKELSEQSSAQSDKLKQKYQPKIRGHKETIKENEYLIQQSKSKLNEATVLLTDFTEKAEKEKEEELKAVQISIEKATEEEISLKNKIILVENALTKTIKTKKSNRDKEIDDHQRKTNELIAKVNEDFTQKKEANKQRKEELQKQQKTELSAKGVDTDRLTIIEQTLSQVKEELRFIEHNRDTVAEYKKDKRELFDKIPDIKSEKTKLEKRAVEQRSKYNEKKRILDESLQTIKGLIQSMSRSIDKIKEDAEKFDEFKKSECYSSIEETFLKSQPKSKSDERVSKLIDGIKEIHYEKLGNRNDELRKTANNFLGKFSEGNVFNFKKQGDDIEALLLFAEDLSEFIEEDKITVIETEVNKRFSSIVSSIGRETTDLVSKEGEIQNVVRKINNDFVERNFAGVIKKIELMLGESKNEVVLLLKQIRTFSDENALELGETNLFSSSNSDAKNRKAVDLLKQFVKKIREMKEDHISLSDSFELKFRIIENENDTGWVEKLSNVGSDGTDVLVKAMINIMLLNVFKEGASRRFKDFRLHCMMDEIGKLHPSNVRGILKFANDRNILLINGSPTENDALAFKHIYKLEKDKDSITKVKRILTQHYTA